MYSGKGTPNQMVWCRWLYSKTPNPYKVPEVKRKNDPVHVNCWDKCVVCSEWGRFSGRSAGGDLAWVSARLPLGGCTQHVLGLARPDSRSLAAGREHPGRPDAVVFPHCRPLNAAGSSHVGCP